MAPTLPTELIKHILELLYGDVRSPACRSPTPFDLMEVAKLLQAFYPFLFVSKTFFALAFPILGRHLFHTSSQHVAIQKWSKLRAAVTSLARTGVKHAIESLTLPPTLSATEAAEVLRGCTRLQTLHLFAYNPATIVSLPAPHTVTTLLLTTRASWGSADLDQLADAFPCLTSLGLEGSSRYFYGGSIIVEGVQRKDPLGWSLTNLAMRDFVGCEADAVALLEQVSSTLETLNLDNDDQTIEFDEDGVDEIHIGAVLDRLTKPFPRLRRLCLGKLSLVAKDSAFWQRHHLPQLTEITVALAEVSLPLLLHLSDSLTRAFLAFADIELDAASEGMDTLLAFVNTHAYLEALIIDVAGWNVVCFEGWDEPLQDLCLQRGVWLSCDSLQRRVSSGEEDDISGRFGS